MLTKSKQAGTYRSQAGALYEDLVDLLLNDEPTLPADHYTADRVVTVKQLLRVGPRQSDGSLDRTRTSPEELDLERELVKLIPREMPAYRRQFNMQTWIDHAEQVLDVVAAGSKLPMDMRDFAERELVPFLRNIVRLGPEEPEVG